MLKEGEKAPEFTTQDENGNEVKLSDFRGQRVVLYFYPKDDTPGCTKEACSFRDNTELYAKEGIKVLGVSMDNGNRTELSRQNSSSRSHCLPTQTILFRMPTASMANKRGATGNIWAWRARHF